MSCVSTKMFHPNRLSSEIVEQLWLLCLCEPLMILTIIDFVRIRKLSVNSTFLTSSLLGPLIGGYRVQHSNEGNWGYFTRGWSLVQGSAVAIECRIFVSE